MDRIFNTTVPIKSARRIAFVTLLLANLISPARVAAQNDSTKAEEKTLVSPSLDLVSIQKADNTIDLKATLKAKVNGVQTKLYGMKITFSSSDSSGKELGQLITDGRGVALLNVKADELKPGADGKLHLKAGFAGNKSAEPADAEVIIKRAKLSIEPVKEDSTLSVKVKLVALNGNEEKAVPETNLGVYVKRSFNPLKLGEGKTDSSGVVSVDIPNNLPGDAKGNLTLLGRLDESDEYGMVEAAVTQPWGVAVSDKVEELPRALWSPHPPLWMLITFIVLMVTVWGHYIVIVYELFRLRKERPKESAA